MALRQGGGLVAALADGVWKVDPESGAAELFVGLGEPPDVRSNESKCDPAGRLLVGTMAFDYLPIGSLYSVEADGSVKRLLDSLSIANGMAWTADGGTLYYIDSPLRRVDAFDYDLATGAISGRRPYLTFDDRVAKPDGMTIDAEGGLWIAFWDAGRDPPLRARPRARRRGPRAGDAGDERRLRRPGSPRPVHHVGHGPSCRPRRWPSSPTPAGCSTSVPPFRACSRTASPADSRTLGRTALRCGHPADASNEAEQSQEL